MDADLADGSEGTALVGATGVGAVKAFLVVLCCSVAMSGCAGQSNDNEAALAALEQTVRGQGDGRSVIWNFDDMKDLVPVEGDDPASANVVVVGAVTHVDERVGGKFVPSGDVDVEGDWIITPFDDPETMSRTFHLTVTVEEVLGVSTIEPGADIIVGFSGASDMTVDDVQSAFAELPKTLWFLEKSPVYSSYSDAVQYGIIGNGRFLGSLKSDGRISFPFASDALSQRLLGGGDTLQSLRSGLTNTGRQLADDGLGM